MIVVVCGGEVLLRSSSKEIRILLFLGALSIIINAIFFPNSYAEFSTVTGRASGFYLNPNFAGVVCLTGYCLTYEVKSYWKYIYQLTFTLAGLLTFSRTFIVIWLLINVVSIYNSRKNFKGIAVGGLVLLLFFSLSTLLEVNSDRFAAFESFFSSKPTKEIKNETRMETWSRHASGIWEKPIFGSGYETFSSNKYSSGGIHNTYLMVWGEAGIIPLLLLLGIYLFLTIKSLKVFKKHPKFLYLTLTIAMAMLASHMYFESFFMVLISMYVYLNLTLKLKIND